MIDLCEFGHTVMKAAAAKVYTKKVNGQLIDRGVAFPVCISVNEVVCNDSPLLSEERVSSRCGLNLCPVVVEPSELRLYAVSIWAWRTLTGPQTQDRQEEEGSNGSCSRIPSSREILQWPLEGKRSFLIQCKRPSL